MECKGACEMNCELEHEVGWTEKRVCNVLCSFACADVLRLPRNQWRIALNGHMHHFFFHVVKKSYLVAD